jgi:hypothetical protein
MFALGNIENHRKLRIFRVNSEAESMRDCYYYSDKDNNVCYSMVHDIFIKLVRANSTINLTFEYLHIIRIFFH